MKVYVAGKFEDKERVKAIYDVLKAFGHTITLDWTNHDHPIDEQDLMKWAIDDIKGVQECDVLIAVFQKDYRYRGALIELGAALGLGKPVIIIGENENSSTLLHHPLVTKIHDISEWKGLEVADD